MNVTEEWIQRTLAECRARQGDTVSVEIKAAQGGLPKSLPETICAMANMPDGGLILLGVKESANFEIVGVEDPAKLESGIVSQAQNAVKPAPAVDTTIVEIDGKHLVLAQVRSLNIDDKPALYKGKPYLRQADGDYPMPLSEQKMIAAAKLHVSPDEAYDQRVVRDSSLEDLDPDLADDLVKRLRGEIKQFRKVNNNRQILRNMRVSTKNDELTLSGLYGLASYPQGFYPTLSVTAAVRLPEDSLEGRTKNLEKFSGPVTDLLDQSLEWVKRNIGTIQRYQPDGHMKSVPEIPLTAVREAIANAIIHRDLGPNALDQGRPVDIRLYDKCLVITNPGGLKSLSIRQLESEEFTRVEVNQHLYRLAQSLRDPQGNRIIEGEGGGIQTMIRECRAAGLKPPLFEDTGVKFTCKLWRVSEVPLPASVPQGTVPNRGVRNVQGRTNEDLLKKLGRNVPSIYAAACDFQAAFTLQELRENTDMSESQVRYGLKPLLDNGFIRRSGGQGRRNTSYTVIR
ncbi:Divergent AAA domain protein [Corynebacterium urogenitale]|uniref:Divergent AAA domain protein n=1 Tax=Corynebacterium urogenitale TaxID=2487892 RepID=A0A5J6Z3D0_9CORY|nr:ATP-binding protein [Corynebacterium urogenitale]QFQ01536.1 Divergent AAA domain protein [Corynebacterium urogenitale]